MSLTATEFNQSWSPCFPQEDLSEINACLFYNCKNNCTFCIHRGKLDSKTGYTEDELLKKLEVFKQIVAKATYKKVLLVLIGGEIFTDVPPSFFSIYEKMYKELTLTAQENGKEFAIEFCTNLQIRDNTPVKNLLIKCPNSILTTSYDEKLRACHMEHYKQNIEDFKTKISLIAGLQTDANMTTFLKKKESSYFKYLYDNFLMIFEPYIETKFLPIPATDPKIKNLFKHHMSEEYPKAIIVQASKGSGEEFFVFPQTIDMDTVKTPGSDAESNLYSQGKQTTS